VAVAPVVAEAPPDAGPSREGLTIHTSIRCEECHEKMRTEWQTSAHASAATAVGYVAARAQAGTPRHCDGCHAPLAAYLGADDPAAREGVTCDVCHNIKTVTVAAQRGRFALEVYDMVKYGPLCDADDHYFHRMGCSPLHGEAELCGACHQLVTPGAGTDALPVLTTYADWKSGPYAEDGVTCQVCHMPGVRAVVAEGSPARGNVPNHDFFGGPDRLRQRAIGLAVEATGTGETIVLDVKVANARAGHYVPSGLPARRLLVRAELVSADGSRLARDERWLGRKLVDARGAEVPFYRAVRVAEDTRIGPKQERRERLELRSAEAGVVVVQVRWRAYAPAIAEVLELAEVADELMAEVELRVGPAGEGAARKGLPGKGSVSPPTASANKKGRK
jgi:hypothetical protein